MSDHRNAQQPVQADALLQLVADTAAAMLAYFEAGSWRCRFANASYAQFFRSTPQGILGKSLAEIAGEPIWAEARAQLSARLAPADSVRYACEMRAPDGGVLQLEAVLRPHLENGVPQGLVMMLTDISEHRQLSRRIRDSEERMRKFAALTTEAIVLHRDGLILDGNDALARLCGYTLQELRGRPILDYIAAEFQLHALQYMRRGRENRYEAAIVHKSGRRIPVEVEARSMPDEEDQYRIVLLRDLTDRRQAQEHLDFLAQHDHLTGLPNRTSLHQMLAQALAQAAAQQTRLSVLCIDLDQFKAVNDSLSHHAGDLLLCEVAKRLRSTIRPHDIVARIGGDDFVVVLTYGASLLETEALAVQLRRIVEAPCDIEGTQLVVSPSMGIAMFPSDGDTPEKLLSNAEAAMHLAKSLGHRALQFYIPTLESRATRMLMQEQLLRQAVEQGQFELHYQPQTSAADGRLVGFEALVRWRHPHRGLVYPDEFIAFAENRGLISAVDNWVLAEACRQAKAWQDAGFPAVPMAVNLSAQEFRQHDVAQEVARVLQATGLAAGGLHIELTESTLMLSGSQMPGTLQALKDLGVGLAIDDFGTGYSSLAYLRRHPIDKIKIDGSFVADVPQSSDATAIVTAIIQMGHSLNLEIVAEGVMTAAQLRLLQELRCTTVQGYLISPALPADQAEAWMSQRCHKP